MMLFGPAIHDPLPDTDERVLTEEGLAVALKHVRGGNSWDTARGKVFAYARDAGELGSDRELTPGEIDQALDLFQGDERLSLMAAVGRVIGSAPNVLRDVFLSDGQHQRLVRILRQRMGAGDGWGPPGIGRIHHNGRPTYWVKAGSNLGDPTLFVNSAGGTGWALTLKETEQAYALVRRGSSWPDAVEKVIVGRPDVRTGTNRATGVVNRPHVQR
jgi:hypothetical protein